MKIFLKVALCLVIFNISFKVTQAQKAKYKCLVQMNSYQGDAAYIVISLINSSNNYEKTLYVLGEDKKWYKSLKDWFQFYNKSKQSEINAITGASISGGDRTMKVMELDESLLNKNYKIRFESAVEDQPYHKLDVEIPFTTESLKNKTDGTGYIKFVKFSKIN